MCDASQLPPDRLAQSITGVEYEYQTVQHGSSQGFQTIQHDSPRFTMTVLAY